VETSPDLLRGRALARAHNLHGLSNLHHQSWPRAWPRRPTAAEVAGFALIGILVTIVFELLATRTWQLWSYSQLMPVIPLLEIGLVPFVQWMVLPPLVIWFVHGQLT
jgi:hypothetical protein